MDDRVYQALAAFISTGLWAAILLEKLEISYKKLARQAHREGMADISTEILHNIGNILNSVNTSADLMKNVIDASAKPLENLARANRLLQDNFERIKEFICKDEKGKKLMQFYIKLGDTFAAFHNQLNYHVNRLGNKINSINNLITAQQNYAGVNEIPEELDIVSVLEDAIRLLWESLESYKIVVVKDYQATPHISAQGIKLFSILVNLINNGKEAMQETPESMRKLIFTVNQDTKGKYIRITDTGCGIAKNMQERIFEYGYSTKKAGHGFGLYICAKYMAEMDARIWVESDGPGKGASFILQFK
jgi:signal transduction histidine kinase